MGYFNMFILFHITYKNTICLRIKILHFLFSFWPFSRFLYLLYHRFICFCLCFSYSPYNRTNCRMAYINSCPFLKGAFHFTIIAFTSCFSHFNFHQWALFLTFPKSQPFIQWISWIILIVIHQRTIKLYISKNELDTLFIISFHFPLFFLLLFFNNLI